MKGKGERVKFSRSVAKEVDERERGRCERNIREGEGWKEINEELRTKRGKRREEKRRKEQAGRTIQQRGMRREDV